MTKTTDKIVMFSLFFFIGIKRKENTTMSIVKKWEIEKGKGHTVVIGVHVVQKEGKGSENKAIGHKVVTGIVLTKKETKSRSVSGQ